MHVSFKCDVLKLSVHNYSEEMLDSQTKKYSSSHESSSGVICMQEQSGN